MKAEIEDEIEFHLQERIRELVAGGAPLTEARRRAEQEFGDVEGARSELVKIDRVTVRRGRRRRGWDAAWGDVRMALRSLRRSPGFSAAVVVALALGIGVNAAMFGITDRILLSPPPHVVDADELVRVLFRHTPSRATEPTTAAILPYADFVVLRDGVAGFSSVAAYTSPSPAVLGRSRDAVELQVSRVTATLFSTLGTRPALGRFFHPDEDRPPRGEAVAVLSHSLWQGRFGGDEGVLGRTVDIDHKPYEVIGVAPEGFSGVDLGRVDVWVLASAIGADWGGEDWATSRNIHWLQVVARLAPAVNAEIVRQQASAVFVAANEERFAGDESATVVLGSVIAARAPEAGVATPQRSGRIALLLLGVSGLVLVIACANVANLLLTRGLRRGREIGLRVALGAGRGRLALHVIAETLVLTGAGSVLGLLVAHWGGQLARSLLLPEVEWAGSPVDHRVLAFAGALALVSALLAAIIPALHAMGVDAGTLLRSGGRTTQRRSSVRSGLVVLQAAVSVVLLAGAGLFVRSLQRAASIPLGFEADRVAVFQWHSVGLDWDRTRVHTLYDLGLERVRALPQVEAAALGMTEPMWSAVYGSIRVPGVDSLPLPPDAGIYYSPVSTAYFGTLGTTVLRGRAFTNEDRPGSEPVVVVTESLARLLWPGESALGRCFVVLRERDDACRRVVGVVENIRYSTVEGDPTHMFFLPMAQAPGSGWRTLFVRFRGDPDIAIPAVRRALLEIEPDLPHVQARLLSSRVDPQLQPWKLGSTLFSAFGVLALVMAALGLYAVVAYDVAQRRREFGVRLALGARPGSLLSMVIGDAGRVMVAGLVIGLAAAGWTASRIEPLLFAGSARDPAVLATAALVLVVIGLFAAALPALRAAQVPATEALREE